MASNYTANYGLCQWEAGDQFVRAEFNQDNAKLDAAIKGVADTAAAQAQAAEAAAQTAQETADQALAALTSLAYNVYNLALRQDLEGKVTGWKRAMLFDGFQDASRIESMSEALVLSGGAVVLSKSIAGTEELANGTSYQYSTSSLDTAAAVAAPGGAYLTRLKLIWKAESSNQVGDKALTFRFYVNGTLHHSEAHTLYFSTSQQEEYVDLTTRVPASAGDSVHFTVSSLGTHYKMPIVRSSNQQIYAAYVFQGTNAAFGTVKTKSVTLPAAEEVRAWVRHVGGTVEATLFVANTGWRMTLQSSRTTVDPNGTSCTEDEFRLSRTLSAGTMAPSFKLLLGSDERCALLDYGVVLL